jgi:predicted secreted protein
MKAPGYRIRQLDIATAGGGIPRPMEMAVARAGAPAAIEAGSTQVAVHASGSIQLE